MAKERVFPDFSGQRHLVVEISNSLLRLGAPITARGVDAQPLFKARRPHKGLGLNISTVEPSSGGKSKGQFSCQKRSPH